jgi:hypothetical protein
MGEIDLAERFPDMEPVRNPPGMLRVNGFGTSVYGKRDFDPETGTYVKTYCVSALFVPVIAVRAYRVADAKTGWYFLGRVPLSPFAKLWNVVVLVAVLSMVGRIAWARHTSSPEYIASERLDAANDHAAAGKLVAAARAYLSVANGKTPSAADARRALRDLVDGPLERAPLADVAKVFRIVKTLRGAPLVPDLLERAQRIVDARGAKAPLDALALLDAAEAPPADPRRLTMVETLVEREPGNLDAVLALAAALEARGETDRCRELLESRRDRIGRGEGARMLGRIYMRMDRLDDALALLAPYASEGLARLQASQKRYEEAAQRVWDRELKMLELGVGPDEFFERYERSDESQQTALVRDYLSRKVQEDPEVTSAVHKLEADAPVASVALDLGLIHLRRAQAAADPDARRAELEEAEKAFLAVRGVAGDTEDYKLRLGQVYHWLGRSEEGDRLFDELLSASDRRPDLMIAIARALRDVGAWSEARTLTEEAWNKATDEDVRYRAAEMRALTPLDTDDEIVWLERSDATQPYVRAMLSSAKGGRHAERGHWNDAARCYRETVDAYAAMPDSGATLNNRALASLKLYECTGDLAAFRNGVAAMRASLRLQPGSGVAVGNSASTLIEEAVLDILAEEFDLTRLRIRGYVDFLACLSPDAPTATRLARRLREHPSLREAWRQIDLAYRLAPRGTLAPELALTVLDRTRELPEMRSLAERVAAAQFDLDDAAGVAQKQYRGEGADKARRARHTAMKAMAQVATALDDQPADRTFQLAVITWTDQAFAALESGEALDPDDGPADAEAVTRWIERAHEAAPTEATYRALSGALVSRAALALVARDAGFAALWKESRLAAGSSNLVAYALGRPGSWRDALKADPDLARAAELTAAYVTRFPDGVLPWDWALLRATKPEAAKRVAARLWAEEFYRLRAETAVRLQPYNGARAFSLHWLRLAAGDEEGARRALAECIARGTPLPGN